jgi:mRNA deadenylase 3'-5' endonuclease subunit Ccr4
MKIENGASYEPPYTTFNFKRNETIDYIFYNNHAFQVKSLGEIAPLEIVSSEEGPSEWINSEQFKNLQNKNGIPNSIFPSDHLPIFCVLQLK